MGRKATRTEEDKKLYNKEYYQKYKELHNRAYQLCGRRTYFHNMILTLQERLKDENSTPDKISKLNDRIEGYKQTLQEIENELKIERQSIWESDYHQNAGIKTSPLQHECIKSALPRKLRLKRIDPRENMSKRLLKSERH